MSYEPPRPPQKLPGMRLQTSPRSKDMIKIVLAVVGGAAALLLAACGVSAVPRAATPPPSAPATPTPAPTPPPPVSLRLGTQTQMQYTYSQTGIQTTFEASADKIIDPISVLFGSPDPGSRYVGVQFTFTGETGETKFDTLVGSGISVIGSNNQVYTPVIQGDNNFDHGTVDVQPGQTETGDVTFDIPNGVTVATVKIGSNVSWTIGS